MKRGRKSIDERITPNVMGTPSRISAPSTLSPRARTLWREIVNACAADHFRPSDAPLLESYVMATLKARDTAKKPKEFATFEKAARLQKSLATSLRLAPSTRTDPKTLARQNLNDTGPRPWERVDDVTQEELDAIYYGDDEPSQH